MVVYHKNSKYVARIFDYYQIMQEERTQICTPELLDTICYEYFRRWMARRLRSTPWISILLLIWLL